MQLQTIGRASAVLWLVTEIATVHAQVALECERYQVEANRKVEVSRQRFSMDQSRTRIDIVQTFGKGGPLPTRARLAVNWTSPDGLRAVATFVDPKHSTDGMASPVQVLDIDFSRPRYRLQSFGGVTDFDTLVSDPWLTECRRLN